MHPISIHKAGPDDADIVTELALALAAYESQPSYAEAGALRAMMQGTMAPQCDALLAKINDEVVGFALYYPGYDLASTSFGFHLADIFVVDAWRGQGVGRRLITAIAERAEAEQREWLSLTVLKHNVRAQGFYQTLGFVRVETDMMAIGKQGLGRLLES